MASCRSLPVLLFACLLIHGCGDDGPQGNTGGDGLAPLGAMCRTAGACQSGFCECADVQCRYQVCAKKACICGYGPDGGCDGALLPGTQDPGQCENGLACGGIGMCKLDNAAPCTQGDQCLSGVCGCTNADCSKKVCNPTDCGCLAATGTGCGEVLGNAVGSCENGSHCNLNVDCKSSQCECESADCSQRRCVSPLADCVCKFGGGGACSQNLNDGVQDPGDCDGKQACFAGMCAPANGTDCTAGGAAACGSGHCECADAACTTKKCGEAPCVCGYVDARGVCAGKLADGTMSAPGCSSAGTTCYAGLCRPTCVDSTTCTGGSVCTNGVCVDQACAGAAGQGATPTGQGTAAAPYVICNAQQFMTMGTLATDVARVFVLGTDINLGTTQLSIADYKGQFDGLGHKLTVMLNVNGAGVFGKNLVAGAKIRNLALEVSALATLTAYSAVAYTSDGTIEDIQANFNTGNVGANFGYSTGIAGRGPANNGVFSRITVTGTLGSSQLEIIGDGKLIEDCKVTANVTTSPPIGSALLSGIGIANVIRRCSYSGNLTATVVGQGGMIGYVAGISANAAPGDGTTISECQSSGTYTMNGDNTSGIVAGIGIRSASISDSYSTATLKLNNPTGADSRVGGIGANLNALGAPHIVSHSYFGGTLTVMANFNYSGSIVDTEALTSASADIDACFATPTYQTGCSGATSTCSSGSATAFYGSSNPAVSAWDFANVWQANAAALPTLRRTPK